MKALSVNEIRQSFLDYFKDKGHEVCPGYPLSKPPASSGLLFVNSGMVAFIPLFTGAEKRSYSRATSSQPSLRIHGKHNDYGQIGRTRRHHTFFEMLGNFSFQDYFKEDAIKYAWDYLTNVLKLDKKYLWVTVHEADEQAAELWQKHSDVPSERIVRLGDDTNRWAMGEYGPNGYCSEIFYYMGDNPDQQSYEEFMKDDGTYLEIWNLVFMQFNKDPQNGQSDLPEPCIDTGMGLERIASVVQGVRSNYEIDAFKALIAEVEKLSAKKYVGHFEVSKDCTAEQFEEEVAMRVIADHTRAISFLIADGVRPTSDGQGYVLRRLIRRAVRYGQFLGIKGSFLSKIAKILIDDFSASYPQLAAEEKQILEGIKAEEEKFNKTLANGLKLLNKQLDENKGQALPGSVAFELYDTYGFPLDLTEEILESKGVALDRKGFDKAMQEQKERSRSARKTVIPDGPSVFSDYQETAFERDFENYNQGTGFPTKVLEFDVDEAEKTARVLFEQTIFYAEKGGQIADTGKVIFQGGSLPVLDCQELENGQKIHLVDYSSLDDSKKIFSKGEEVNLYIDEERRNEIAKHHSATHILHHALRSVLGDEVGQKGSAVMPDRLRFDFSYSKQPSIAELTEVMELAMEMIAKNDPVVTEELPIKEALNRGALAFFEDKYGDKVRLVTIGDSLELCGGTHVKQTGVIGNLLITSEGSIASGVRRIEAVCADAGRHLAADHFKLLKDIQTDFKIQPEGLYAEIQNMQNKQKELSKQLQESEKEIVKYLLPNLQGQIASMNGKKPKLIMEKVSLKNRGSLLDLAKPLVKKNDDVIVVIASKPAEMVLLMISDSLKDQFAANEIVKKVTEDLKVGRGGGRPMEATLAQCPADQLDNVLNFVKQTLL